MGPLLSSQLAHQMFCELFLGKGKQTVDREAMVDQSVDSVKVWLSKPVSLLGLFNGMGDGLLAEHG